MHDTPGGDGGFPHTFPHTLLSLGSRRCMAHRRKPVLLLALVRIRERLGSGGPRGLQILRSGVKSVRGGFDSHAFPPIVLALALVLGRATPAAGAAGTPVAAPPDSVRVIGRTIGLKPPGRFDSPRAAMIRSA